MPKGPELSFQECAVCAAKPGSPPLCPSCLHNRAVIDELTRQVQQTQGKTLMEVFAEEDAKCGARR